MPAAGDTTIFTRLIAYFVRLIARFDTLRAEWESLGDNPAAEQLLEFASKISDYEKQWAESRREFDQLNRDWCETGPHPAHERDRLRQLALEAESRAARLEAFFEKGERWAALHHDEARKALGALRKGRAALERYKLGADDPEWIDTQG